MPNEYKEQWDEYNQTHEKAADAKTSHDNLRNRRVEASKEALAQRKEQLATIQKFYDLMKTKEAEIVSRAKEFADQNSPDNIQMYLDAYTEYFDYLGNQVSVSDEQISALIENIDALETLVKNQELRKEAQQKAPVNILKEFQPEEAEKIQTLFVGEVAQEIADLHGMTPEKGFSQEKLSELYQRATNLYKDDGDIDIKPHPPLIGPVRIIKASPGWTGHAKYKN